MSKTSPPLTVPAPIPEEHFAQNGDLASPSVLRRAAQGFNFSGHSQRRLIAEFVNGVQATPIPTSTTSGIQYFCFRTGPAVRAVVMLVGMAPANSATTSPAGCRLSLKPSGSELQSAQVYHTAVAGSPGATYTPAEIVWSGARISVDDGLTALTEYRGRILQYEYCRIHAAMFYEIAEPVLDSTVTGIADPLLYEAGKPIYSQQLLAQTGTELWRHNASQLLSWSRDDETGIVRTNATWANVLNVAQSAWGAATPGYHLQTLYHDSQKADIPVTLGVYATRTAGAGNLEVKLEQTGGTLLSTSISAAGSPFSSSTHTIAAAVAEKTDILVRCSDGSTTWRIDAISLWEYES